MKQIKKELNANITPLVSPRDDKMTRKKSILYVRETWAEKVQRIRAQSPFGSHPNWGILISLFLLFFEFEVNIFF